MGGGSVTVFIKLVVLILVCGSSGVGLLSVRQSRLQTAHEMAEARHRIQRLNERGGEIRTHIAQACTPDQVYQMLQAHHKYDHAVHHPAEFAFGSGAVELDTLMAPDGSAPQWMDDAFRDEHAWILDDGSRVILIEDDTLTDSHE